MDTGTSAREFVWVGGAGARRGRPDRGAGRPTVASGLHRRLVACLLCLSAAMATSGCPREFEELADEAPIHVYEIPDDFRGRRYGSVVAAYAGELPDGTPASRVVASGGADTSFEVLPVWTGGLDLGPPRFQGCEQGACRAGAGTALAGLPVFHSPSNLEEQRLCVLVPAPSSASQQPQVLCETRTGTLEGIGAQVGNVGLGESVVGLAPGDPVGLALLGAPRTAMGRGGVFALRGQGAEATIGAMDQIDLSAAQPTSSAGLGSQVAAAPLPDGRTLLATTAGGMNRIVLAALADDGDEVASEILGCIDPPQGAAPDFGSALAVGDVLGDGFPDIVVGGEATDHTPVPVMTYRGSAFGGAAGCDATTVAPEVTLECAGPLDGLRDVSCNRSAFGAALATGDFTGDGVAELAVGAPRANVDGMDEAGAVFVFSMVAPDDHFDVLTHSDPDEGDHLGTALTTALTLVDTAPRAEVVAGMPGANAVAIFLCTGLEGDTPAVGARCIPHD